MFTTQKDMLNISACDYPEFEAYMKQNFCEEQFLEGYEIIKANQDNLY